LKASPNPIFLKTSKIHPKKTYCGNTAPGSTRKAQLWKLLQAQHAMNWRKTKIPELEPHHHESPKECNRPEPEFLCKDELIPQPEFLC
jgi:hypothetical protein